MQPFQCKQDPHALDYRSGWPEHSGTRGSVLFSLIDHFDRSNLGIVELRREGKEELALTVGMQAMELANDRLECAAGRLDNIEVLEQHRPVAAHVE